VRAVCNAVICGPARQYAQDTLENIDSFAPDLVVSNELLFGVMAAAEAKGTRLALLTGNLWPFPTRLDVPPFGPGFAHGSTHFARARDARTRVMIARWYDAGLDDLNAARAALGLSPLARVLDQFSPVRAVLLGVAAAFDFSAHPPLPFVYVGPLGEMPRWVDAKAGMEDVIDPSRPNVLVSFSTTFQNQAAIVSRCIRALAGLPVRGVITLGPAVAPDEVPRAPNLRILAQASHDWLMPHLSLVICHGGQGTVARPLMAGVPVICIPMGRDQPENAQRIAQRGAGLRLPRWATAGRIRRAAARVLADPGFAKQAALLGAAMRAEWDNGERAAALLEALTAEEGNRSHAHLA
jgi:UDP:flavonoid glycosyltransferase YjiC (YdhE family)